MKTRVWSRRRWISKTGLGVGSAAVFPKGMLASLEGFASHPGRSLLRDAVSPKLRFFPFNPSAASKRCFFSGDESNYDFISSLPNDRLLHMFRVTAGISSSAAPLGGWEEPKSELRGHFAGGHILSACALHYAASGDDKIKRKGDALVAELAKCQTRSTGGLSQCLSDRVLRSTSRAKSRVWAPFYTYHKILAGHLDMYTLCGNQQALAIAENMAGWVGKYLKPISDEQWAKIQMVEHGGIRVTVQPVRDYWKRAISRGWLRGSITRNSSIRWPNTATNSTNFTPTRIFPRSSALRADMN